MSNEKDLMGYDPLEWLKEDNAAPAAEATAPPEAEPEIATPLNEEAELAAQASEPLVEDAPAAVSVDEAPGETTADSAILDLQNSLQIMDVAILKQRLEESLNALTEITLRADENIVVDGAGMQLLLAFVVQATSNGVKLQWEALPIPISEAARLLNCEQVLLAD